MSEQIIILDSTINKLEYVFNEFSSKYIELTNFDNSQIGLFDSNDEGVRNREFEVYRLQKTVHLINEIDSIKTKVLKIKNEYSNIQDEINITTSLLHIINKNKSSEGIQNPYEIIYTRNVQNLEERRRELEERVLIIFTRNEAHLIHLYSSNSQNLVAQIILDIIENDINDDLEEIYLENYISEKNIDLLKYLGVPVFDKVLELNAKVKSRIQEHLLNEYWEIEYNIIFKIKNVRSVIENDDVFQDLYDLKDYKIYKDSIEISRSSDDDVDGNNIHPHDYTVKEQIKHKLERIVENEIGESYENEILQRIYELSNGEFEVELLNFSFPESGKVEKLNDSLD